MQEKDCSRWHIKKPIPDKDWKCPKCGGDNKVFAIWDTIYLNCDKEHGTDHAYCMTCGYSSMLKTLTDNYWKGKGVTFQKCKCCNGTGLVPKELKATVLISKGRK